MNIAGVHHVSLTTRDLPRAVDSYTSVFGLKQIPRPAFATVGAWLALGANQLHLIVNADGTFRRSPHIDTGDVHFAVDVTDFDATVAALQSQGFDEALPDGDPRRIVVRRKSIAGFEQAYLLDPDCNIIEINSAP
jgi:glyoxylase I family protein